MMRLERSNEAWLADLDSPGFARDAAIEDLLTWLERRIHFYLRSRSDLGGLDDEELRQMAGDFAQDSILIILEKKEQFQGRSKFTTWAAKIAVHQALGELRRARWRDLSLDGMMAEDAFDPGILESDQVTPESATLRGSVIATVMDVMQNELSERQRQALYARLVMGIPSEILAEQMDTNPNALYKLIHDARKRMRNRLIERGISPDEVLATFS